MAKDTSRFQIWKRIIKSLNNNKLDYVLVGAAALVVHGLPRSTLDVDIYLPARTDTLVKIFGIAKALGLHSQEKDILKLSRFPKLFSNQWISFSYKGQDILDIFFSDEKEFIGLFKDSELKRDKNIIVRVSSLKELKKMKKASGRPQDLADIKLIEQTQKLRRI
ncbi:MAG: hypothetical protein AB1481_01005 [Candidatus Omnitrophota bacterium]